MDFGRGLYTGRYENEAFSLFQKITVSSQLIYCVASTFIKLSLLTFYLRLSSNSTFRICVYILMAICTSFGVANVFSKAFQCHPLSTFWDFGDNGVCVDVVALYYSILSIHLATEIAIMVLPIPILLKLQVPFRQRFGIILLFCLGGV
jgi:hypothetical protein